MREQMKTMMMMTGIIFGHFLFSQDCTTLIWSDEFDGDKLDTKKWNIDIGNGCPGLCGWGNNELQYYSDESNGNIEISDGRLIITAKRDNIGGANYSSGKILTKGLASFKYGRIEASIKMPESQGMWPAFWMLSSENLYGEWPRSGEIDIVELVGDKPEEILGTMHTGLPYKYNSGSYKLSDGKKFSDSFHVFAVEWAPDSIQWFVDDIKYHSVHRSEFQPWSPFEEEFYLIFNLAVGGNLPGNPDATTILPQTLEVEYVRVYNEIKRLTITGDQPFPNQKGVTYSSFEIEGANYNWTVPEGATLVSGQGTNEIQVDWGCSPGEINLEVSTDCDSVTLSYNANQFSEFIISGLGTVVNGSKDQKYSVPFVEGATYEWIPPGDAAIKSGQGTNEVIIDFGEVQGDLLVNVTTDCGTEQSSLPIILRSGNLLCDFDNVDLPWNVFGGATIMKVVNPFKNEDNSSTWVGQSFKSDGAEVWGGIYADLGTELNLENEPYLHMQVYTSRSGIVNFKLEDATNGANPIEIEIQQDVTNKWVDMVWDFSTESSGVFDRLALFFDFNKANKNTWFFDNIQTSTKNSVAVNSKRFKSLKVSPNPVDRELTIYLEDSFQDKNFDVRIHNLEGKTIFHRNYSRQDDKIKVDVQGLVEGMYILQLKTDNLIYVTEFVKVD